MKTLTIILLILLFAGSYVHAQKTISLSDTYEGKTVLDMAKEHAAGAYLETRTIYKDGMTESAFVNECLKLFPKQYYSLRDLYVPYAKYIYAFHKLKLTEDQVRGLVTGKEYLECINSTFAWSQVNPGFDPASTSWWKKLLLWLILIYNPIPPPID
jgi:hypothetical protein